VITIDLAIAETSIQRRAVLYDKEGDAHFDTISALIKSLRGSDPDAALYWLAKMVYAGEDPRFLFRRMLILASEDIGLADPQAVMVVMACAQAFDRMGLPEGHYPLAQAALYLATAPKSNSVMGFFDALRAIEQEQEADVPSHLKDANRDKHSFGHGANYQYPHAYRDHWVAQQYLPASLQGQLFYQPSDQGYEAQVQARIAQQREAQLAAMLEQATALEVLSYSPQDASTERWLQRSIGQSAQQLGHLRQQLFQRAGLQRHDLVLDLNAGSGLLTWEALRQVPEGGVYAQVLQSSEAEALQQQAQSLPELRRPVIIVAAFTEVVTQLQHKTSPVSLKFELILGRNLCLADTLPPEVLGDILGLLQPQGKALFAESLPRAGQRIYQLLSADLVGKTLYRRWQKAEDAIYTDTPSPRLAAQPQTLQQRFAALGVAAKLDLHTQTTERLMTPNLLQRWFSPDPAKRALHATSTQTRLRKFSSTCASSFSTKPSHGKLLRLFWK
jgi:putative ATPase